MVLEYLLYYTFIIVVFVVVTFYYKLIIQIWGPCPDYIIIYIKNINRKKKD
jgi:hypothetical protein